MEHPDAETLLAKYMFVNHGWAPGELLKYSTREKVLMLQFMVDEIKSRNRK